MPRKINSYLGGSLADPNRPEFSYWDWIMNRRQRGDTPFRGRGSPIPPPPGTQPGNAALFTDEFYRALQEKVPLQDGVMSPYLGAPVVPVLDLFQMTQGAALQGGMNPDFANRMYANFIPADGFPPIVAGGVAGFVKAISCLNPIGSGKTIFPVMASLDAAAQFQGWRRHNSPLATPLASGLHPKRVTDGVTGSPARFTAEQIANAVFPGGGPLVSPANNLSNWPSSNTFQPASPTIIPFCWLKPGEGIITFKTSIFGNPVDGGGMSHGTWLVLEA